MTTPAIKRWLAATALAALSVGCSSEEANPPAGAAGSSGGSSGSIGGAGGAATGTGGGGGAATGTGGAGGAATGTGGGGTAGAGGAPTLVGSVNVDLITDDHTGFLAVFFDGTVPSALPLVVRTQQAGCMLLVPAPVLCEPPCAEGSVCTGVSQCTRRPMQVGVGTLRVQGLGGMDLELEPTAPTVLSYQVVPTLPYPPCSEGDNVRVHADAFDLLAKCISPLTVTSPVPIPVTLGQPMHLTWTKTPPAVAGSTRIQIELEISHHGGYKGEIDCDVPDNGAFDIPEPLITELVERGRAGYPTVKVARRAIGVAPTQPRVRLILSSLSELEVDTGVISCGAGDSPPCPTGTTCQGDFTCR